MLASGCCEFCLVDSVGFEFAVVGRSAGVLAAIGRGRARAVPPAGVTAGADDVLVTEADEVRTAEVGAAAGVFDKERAVPIGFTDDEAATGAPLAVVF